MKKLRFIGFFAGVMLLTLSLALLYVQGKNMLAIPSADSYADEGVRSFTPYQVLPVQVESTAVGRYKRLNPTRTVYMVYYKADDGSGYKWQTEASSESAGMDTVAAGEKVERRILVNSGENTYISVEPQQTAKSYTAGLRRQYLWMIGLSAAYIVGYGIVWILLLRKRRRERT